jgi:hypothetical protein
MALGTLEDLIELSAFQNMVLTEVFLHKEEKVAVVLRRMRMFYLLLCINTLVA